MSALRRHYRVLYREDITSREGYLAGSDARRLEELNEALRTEGVDAIMAVRGGFGATRLVPHLDAALIEQAARPLLGFSDITALQLLWAKAGVGSYHCPMVAALGDEEGPRVETFAAQLEAGAQGTHLGDILVSGSARGRLLGGNLSVLASLIGTGALPSLRGSVLLLEDVGEKPYRVDRMLTHLRYAGVLRDLKALVFGAFTDSAPGPDGTSVDDVLRASVRDLGIPVLKSLPFGHLREPGVLPFGAEVTIDATGEQGILQVETR